MYENHFRRKPLYAALVGGAVALAAASGVAHAGSENPAPAKRPLMLAAGCNPCAAKKACGACNPCAAKRACGACNPCAAKKPCGACNPCNPCAAKKNPCNPCAAKKSG